MRTRWDTGAIAGFFEFIDADVWMFGDADVWAQLFAVEKTSFYVFSATRPLPLRPPPFPSQLCPNADPNPSCLLADAYTMVETT